MDFCGFCASEFPGKICRNDIRHIKHAIDVVPTPAYGTERKVERLFAWLHNFRRLVVRYEFHVESFLSMSQLGCIVILLRLIM